MARAGPDRNRPPLDLAALERLALDYVGRYATSRAKLRTYLERKVRNRGWDAAAPPPLDAIVARLAGSGFVDDRAFAVARGAGLARRGYGARRVGEALRAAGIEAGDVEPAIEDAGESAWAAAEIFAKRRKIGPFSSETSEAGRRRAYAAMLRAGHPPTIAQAFARAAPGDIPRAPD